MRITWLFDSCLRLLPALPPLVVAFCLGPFMAVALTALAILHLRKLRRTHECRRMKDRLAALHEERQRVARDFHDTVLQSFQAVLLQMHLAWEKLPSSAPGRHDLARALDLAQAALEEGRDKVSDLRIDARPGADLAAELSTACAAMSSRVVIVVRTEGEVLPLLSGVHEECHMIALEAVRNALSHAGAGRIEVGLRYGADVFVLAVRDDGQGCQERAKQRGHLRRHWGMAGMRERAHGTGGKFDCISVPGQGMTITVVIPGHRAYGGAASAPGHIKSSWSISSMFKARG